VNDDQLLRYSRHILLNEVGVEGQEKLLHAHALIIGAGGLGSPAAIYLAAAGVGRITLADNDKVDFTNLQRQILHNAASVGRMKAESGRSHLAIVNPEVEVVAIEARAEGALLTKLVAEADVVLDCSDNFATRHAINRACIAGGKPLVSGAALRFDGQVAVFDLRRGDSPCYHCLFPESAASEELRCAVMGVFAPLTGIVGSIQAAETLKLIMGIGDNLTGRLLLIDALGAESRCIRFKRDPECPACAAREPLQQPTLKTGVTT
jgi:molybdopterin/thiamine biosynthesis adenylyltransferase